MDHIFRLGFIRGRLVDLQLGLIDKGGPDLQRRGAVAVLFNHLHRGVKDRLRRAVILVKLQQLGIGKILLKAQKIFPLCPAKTIDRLIRVADCAEIRAGWCQQPQQPILGIVDILVLIDRQPAIARLVIGQH